MEAIGPWAARVLWLALGLVAGPVIDDALGDRSGAVRMTVTAGLAGLWTAGLVALLVPRSSSLTAVRVVVPGGLGASLALVAAGSGVDGFDVVMVTVASLAVAAALAPWVAAEWVNGSSYGSEQRLPLQTPVIIGSVIAPATWLAVATGISAGPLLLASRQWVPGIVALAVGAPVATAGVRSLHQLARRWIVMVPTGMVVHDPLAMPEPQLFPRRSIRRLGPAEVGTEAVDLTVGASGLALELSVHEPVDLLVRGPGRGTSSRTATAVLITPSRARQVLEAAAERRIPVAS